MVRAGPWGFWDALFLLSPIALLVVLVLKPNPLPTTKCLWLAAMTMFVIKLWYLEAAPEEATACFVKGCLQAITPCSIVAGAIYLFDCMESSQCLAWMKVQLRIITNSHPVAEVMLIGFCFAFVVEGASGFGTPAALAAPMLYSMGHPKLECVVCLLLFNTFMTIFGAVGTPVWFGVGEVVPEYGDDKLLAVGWNAAIGIAVYAVVMVPYVVSIIVPWADLKRSLLYIVVSTLSVILPFVTLSFFTYEFPTMAGGIVGLVVTTALTQWKVGLGPHSRRIKGAQPKAVPKVEGDAVAAAPLSAAVPADPTGLTPPTEERHSEKDAPSDQGPQLQDLEKQGLQEQSEQPRVSGTSAGSLGDEPRVSGHSANAPGEKPRVSGISADAGGKSRAEYASDGPRRNASSISNKSLKERAVNSEVDIDKKHVKKMLERQSMTVAPAQVVDKVEDADFPVDIKVGISDIEHEQFNRDTSVLEAIGRTMPLWLTVVLLILTRLEFVGLKDVLKEDKPEIVDGNLGTMGHLSISTVGRFHFSKILGTGLSWTYELLYTPFILPFVVAGTAPLLVFHRELSKSPLEIIKGVVYRIKGPCVALAGALVLVELLRTSDSLKDSPAVIIGTRLSDTLSDGFVVLSFLLGALGSFFSGSTTVSMLTFTQVQKVAADELGVQSEALIALQLCGASAGNAFCLSNIIAATAVIGLSISEGAVIKRVLLPVFAAYVICTAVLLPFAYA